VQIDPKDVERSIERAKEKGRRGIDLPDGQHPAGRGGGSSDRNRKPNDA